MKRLKFFGKNTFWRAYPKEGTRRGPLRGKKGLVSEYLPWLIIAVAVLAILMIAIFVLKGKGVSVIDKFGGLFRGR